MYEQKFLLRLWCEQREIEQAAPEVRGLIEHIASGDRRYLNDLHTIPLFIAAYLEQMGVDLGTYWHTRLWMEREQQEVEDDANRTF